MKKNAFNPKTLKKCLSALIAVLTIATTPCLASAEDSHVVDAPLCATQSKKHSKKHAEQSTEQPTEKSVEK